MFELLSIILFVWLLFKAFGIVLKLTWGIAKIAACVLIVLAVPILPICLLFMGGIALLLPFVLIAAAVGIGRTCIGA